MTTIVYYKGAMAADRFVSGPTSVYCDKIVQCDEGFVGVCGDIRVLLRLVEWLTLRPSLENECANDSGDSFVHDGTTMAILVRPDRTVWILYSESTKWVQVDNYCPVAIGSGAQFAVGAAWVSAGAYACEAEMAVRVAAIFDPGTKVDGGVQVIKIPVT